MGRRAKPPKVIERNLARERAHGQSWQDGDRGFIELSTRMRGERTRLATLLHEATHLCQPELSESKTEEVAQYLCAVLWGQHYRRVRM